MYKYRENVQKELADVHHDQILFNKITTIDERNEIITVQ